MLITLKASFPRTTNQSAFEKGLIEIGEIQPVLVQVGETLRLVPEDFHDYNVATL